MMSLTFVNLVNQWILIFADNQMNVCIMGHLGGKNLIYFIVLDFMMLISDGFCDPLPRKNNNNIKTSVWHFFYYH